MTDVTITNVAFTATRPTYFEPRGNPSGGDWALERMGALFIEGAERVVPHPKPDPVPRTPTAHLLRPQTHAVRTLCARRVPLRH